MKFELDEREKAAIESWCREHDKSCHYAKDMMSGGAIGGIRTYHITHTTVGTVTKLVCACGAQLDFTDYSCW